MKKYYSIILALVMVFALCACNKDDSPTIDDGGNNPSSQGGSQTSSTAQFKGKLLEPTMNLIASGNYMYELQNPQTGSPVTYARYGNNYLITLITDQGPSTYIVKDGKKYLAFANEKWYVQLTDADIKQYNIEQYEKLVSAINVSTFSTYTFKAAGETSIGDITYKYEDYYNPLNQQVNRFCFSTADNTLKYIASVNADGTTGDTFAAAFYASTASVFDVLNTYTLVDLNSQTAMQPSTN